jgi:cyclopropane-fatty-acyl-phospholipid synthase
MLAYAAKHHGISGLGVTLSEEQVAWAERLFREEGLSDRVQCKLLDYRQVEGTFDKFVSIGMFEHVRRANYPLFMQIVRRILKPEGLGLLHTIGTESGGGPDPWIDTYIFPGGELPLLPETLEQMRRAGLSVLEVENWKPDYATTLRHWKKNVDNHWDEIAAIDPQKFSERFRRMWDYYLQSCEAGFRYGDFQLFRILFRRNP